MRELWGDEREIRLSARYPPTKGDPDFINWLNNFLRQYKNDGRYEVLYNKWIKSTDWYANVK